MDKIWYIFIDNHHMGPFSAEEIFKMFHSDELHEGSLVWRQGLSKWLYLKDCEELWNAIAPLKSLPELPLEEKPLAEKEVDLPPSLPFKNLPELPLASKDEDEIPKLPSENLLEVPLAKVSKKRKISWGWLAAGIFICVVLAFFLGQTNTVQAPQWGGLSLLESERLKNITQVRLREGLKIGLAGLAKDKRIFLASNRSGPAVVTIQLSSIPKKILGNENVVFTGEAKLEGHYAVFDQLKFLSSDHIVPGYYRVTMEAVAFSPYRQVINQLIRWNILSKEGYSEKFIYKGELLIADVPPSRFQENLDAYASKLAEEAAMPYIDLKERYNTLASFVEQLMGIYSKAIEQSKEGFDQKAFEKTYDVELGHPYKVFVEDSVKLRDEYATKRPHMVDEFDGLVFNATNIGALVGEMLDKTLKKASSKKKKIKEKGRKELLEYFSQKVEKLRIDIKTKQDELEQKIDEAKKMAN